MPCLLRLLLQEENEGEEDLLDQLSSLLSAVLKQQRDAAMPLLDGLMPQLAPLLEAGASPEERRVALCALDDILEFAPSGARASVVFPPPRPCAPASPGGQSLPLLCLQPVAAVCMHPGLRAVRCARACRRSLPLFPAPAASGCNA
jgi:hypothetical protein